MIDKLRRQVDALLEDLRKADRRTPRLAVTELERRDVPAPLNTKDLLNVYLDQTTSQFGEIGMIDNGLGVYDTFIDQETQNFGNANNFGEPRFGVGGVATLNGDVYIFDTKPGITDLFDPTDDASALYRLDPETGAVQFLNFFGRESGGLTRTPDGMLLNVWYDGVYGSNAAGNPDSATVGISKIDPFTGQETILFSRPVSGIPVTSTDPPAFKPNGIVTLNGQAIYADTRVGRTGNLISALSPVGDLTIIHSVDLASQTESDIGTYARESRGLGLTTDGQLVNGSFDGLYGTSPYGTPDAANNLLTLIDLSSGSEELLESFPVPNLPYSGAAYGNPFEQIPPIQKFDGIAVGIGLPGVLPFDNEVYFTLTSPVRRDTFNGTLGVEDNTQLYVRDAFNPAVLLKTFNRQSLGLTIVPKNSAPVTQPDFYSTPTNQTLTVPAKGVLANDFDPDANTITAVLTTPPTADQGTVSLAADGSFVFTPTPNFIGTATFTYSATDGIDTTGPVTVTIFVTNQAPTTSPDAYSTPAGQALTVPVTSGVLVNDSDTDGPPPLTAILSLGSFDGVVALNSDGSFTFTPNAGFVGQAYFLYVAQDGIGAKSSPTVVTIDVTNTVPVASDDNYSTPSNKALTIAAPGVLVNDFDPDTVGPDGTPGTPDDLPGTLTVVLVSPPDPTTGSVSLAADGSFVFTPAADYFGSASFTYQASDGFGVGNLATVTIDITNQHPIVSDDNYSTMAGVPLTVTAPGLLANDTDPDMNGTLAVASFTPPVPSQGTLSVNSDGSFTFTPAVGFTGQATFSYTATDGISPSDQFAQVIINVTGPSSGPTATNDSYNIPAGRTLTVEAPGVLGNDTAVSPTATLLNPPLPAQGSVTLNPDGSFTFVPNPTFAGIASFQYLLTDQFGQTASALVSVTVTNSGPFGQPDAYSTPASKFLIVPAPGVFANDVDAEGNGPFFGQLATDVPAGQGALSFGSDGSFQYSSLGFVGTTSFTYRVADAAGFFSQPVTVTITVVNQPPVAVDDAFSTPAGKALSGQVTGNDFDPDGSGPFPAQLVTDIPASEGTLSLSAYSGFTFTPAAGFVGQTSFTYRIFDSVGTPSNVATVQINVTDTAPLALPDAFSTPAGQALVIAAPGLLGNDSDPDGQALTAILSVPPAATQGTVSLNPDGSFTFTPATGFDGNAIFQYVANDGFVNSAPVTVTIAVLRVNRPPVAVNDVFTTQGGKALTVAAPGVLANDTDADGDTLTALLDTGTVGGPGTLVLNPNGSFTYTPPAGYTGSATFRYFAVDGSTSTPATITITVANQPPTGPGSDSFTIGKNKTLTVAAPGLLTNDTDSDGDPLFAVLDTGVPAGQGTLTFNRDGSFVFVPVAGFVGQTSFTYRASDGFSTGELQTVTLTVTNAQPVAQPDSFATVAGQTLTIPAPGVLANDTDADGDPLVVAPVANSAVGGTVSQNPNGSFTFTPAIGFVGTASFAYRASDGTTTSNPVTVNVLVTPPATGRTTLYAVGAGAGGGPRVRVFDAATDQLRFDFFVYEPTFDGGVRVAVGDVTGDGVDDIVVGTGTGGGPRVVVFDGSTGDRIADFFAYEASFRGGVHVAVGDLDGDGIAEVIAGAGSTGEARVRSFAGKTFAPQLSFYAFPRDAFGGVRVAAGDLDGDGKAEIVATEGLSGKGVVAVFSGTGVETARFDAFPGYRGGLFVATLGNQVVVSRDSVIDYQGSVFDFLEPGLALTDVSGGPEVRLFDYRAGLTGRPAPVQTLSAYDPGYQGGVRISTAADPSGRFQLMTAPGELGGSAVKFFARQNGVLQPVGQLTAYEPTFLGGVFVGASAGPFDLDV